MGKKILEVKNLRVRYGADDLAHAVHDVSLSVEAGERIGIIGESGSGKSTLALSIMGLVKAQEISGSVFFEGADLLNMSEREKEKWRWRRIAIVFQNSMDVLNPVMTVGDQISEAIIRHRAIDRKHAEREVGKWLRQVGLESTWQTAYPHQLSGGMRQRVLIAMAISCEPEVLIADEPTMALDAASKREMVEMLKTLQQARGFAMITISHEFDVIGALASKTLVMYAGNVIESGQTEAVMRAPKHPYTRGLMDASPMLNPYRDMWGIPGEVKPTHEHQCPFYNRCNQRIEACLKVHPKLEVVGPEREVACIRGGIVTLLSGQSLSKKYKVNKREINACSECDIEIKSGEVVALIGASGSGKTTLAGILSGTLEADAGCVIFEGRRVKGNSETSRRQGIQIVFQDPFSASNEHLSILDIVKEPLDVMKAWDKEERIERAREVLKQVQLPSNDLFLKRRGHTLSGGQRQRLAVARALITDPKLLIADEISAMLDPSNAANMLRLLKGLQNSRGFSMLYVTHDLAFAQKIADTVYVMQGGVMIENGTVSEIFRSPKTDYTRALIGMDQSSTLKYAFNR